MEKKRNPNRWIEFVKSYSKHTNQTYGCALSNPKTKIAYHKYMDDGGREKSEKLKKIKKHVDKRSKLYEKNI